ncbi:MAG: hypothetical protein MZU91_14010 [Desulfosudis oleivorans]|nr:hypothetical protein [Desulfosudis oleivorans]
MQQISEGNIDIAPDITDDKDEIGPALNKMINAIGSMSEEINRCCLAALEGNLMYRADATSFHGKYQKIVQGFNDTLDAVMAPLERSIGCFSKTGSQGPDRLGYSAIIKGFTTRSKNHQCGW